MNVLFATSELYPWVKTGGLADVSKALPEALAAVGVNVTIIVPGYPDLVAALGPAEATYPLFDEFVHPDILVWEYELPASNVSLLVVCSESLFERPGGPYLDASGVDWPDNAHRFAQFCRAITAVLNPATCDYPQNFDWVHCNDWQTGLVPALVALNRLPVKTMFTIHNLAYQGVFERDVFDALKLPDGWWHYEKLEFYGRFSFLKAGVVFSHQITTVSPTYAREILDEPMGCGMAGLLRYYQHKLLGILNGVDYQVWNPESDPHLAANYNLSKLDKKALNKAALQVRFNLEEEPSVPLFGLVSRLTHQKGIDWLLTVISQYLDHSQWVILGSGETDLERRLQALAKQYSMRIGLKLGYDEALAHQIEAGSDVFVMPSRYEPCGLNQLYSLRYGTLPLVHSTGGLADTVDDAVTGFVFTQPTAEALSNTIERAIEHFRQRSTWRRMQKAAMRKTYDWQRSAKAYLQLYKSVC